MDQKTKEHLAETQSLLLDIQAQIIVLGAMVADLSANYIRSHPREMHEAVIEGIKKNLQSHALQIGSNEAKLQVRVDFVNHQIPRHVAMLEKHIRSRLGGGN